MDSVSLDSGMDVGRSNVHLDVPTAEIGAHAGLYNQEQQIVNIEVAGADHRDAANLFHNHPVEGLYFLDGPVGIHAPDMFLQLPDVQLIGDVSPLALGHSNVPLQEANIECDEQRDEEDEGIGAEQHAAPPPYQQTQKVKFRWVITYAYNHRLTVNLGVKQGLILTSKHLAPGDS